MATLTIVITYTAGAAPGDEDVQSFTSAGTGHGSLTTPNLSLALRLMRKARMRALAERASQLARG